MTPLDNFLSRLEKVKRNGKGYLACCPAHNDKTPSMTIKETSSGSVVFHCFAGCAPESIVSAIGLTFSDLYPDSRGYKPAKPNLDLEYNIIAIAKECRRRGKPISEMDKNRVALAVHRIKAVEGGYVG